ncbi:hypothetical protein D3C76_1596850 [compost metagenome]
MSAYTGVHSELQPFGMDIIGKRLHPAREFFGIRDQIPLCISFLQAPAVINDNVLITGSLVASCNKGIGGLADQLFIDVPGKGVPGVPAQWGLQAKLLCAHLNYASSLQLEYRSLVYLIIFGT